MGPIHQAGLKAIADAQVLAGKAPPRGRYPHIKRAGDFVYVSGTSARRPDNSIAGASVDAMGTASLDIRLQTQAVIETIGEMLAAAGAQLSDLIQVTTYLVNMNDFAGYNEVWAGYFDETGPTRTTVAVHQLPHPHLLIEMQAVAHAPREVADDTRPADQLREVDSGQQAPAEAAGRQQDDGRRR